MFCECCHGKISIHGAILRLLLAVFSNWSISAALRNPGTPSLPPGKYETPHQKAWVLVGNFHTIGTMNVSKVTKVIFKKTTHHMMAYTTYNATHWQKTGDRGSYCFAKW